jgi:CheY-like chemotaxis protein
LARRLVAMHGGRIEARNDGIGCGSEFLVRLPLVLRVPAETARPDASRPVLIAPRRVLIVDDNRDAADSLALLLESPVTEVRVAYDGLAALEALADFKPEVVVLDLGMPGMNGYETARRIREQPQGLDLPLIALTGWGQDADRRRRRRAGFDHHCVKPVDIDVLQTLLVSADRRDEAP